MPGREVLFSGQHVDLVLCGEPDNRDVCVTFSPLCPAARAEFTGFGEFFLAKRDVTALHFIAKANHWWNTPEMAPCLDKAAPVLARASRRVGYGSSMGGYGALRFSEPLGLDAILAFCPQYAVDPARVPWETRWHADRNRITRFQEDYILPESCQTAIVYDPDYEDARHVDLIATLGPLHRIHMRGVGHFTVKTLRDAGLLEPLALAAIVGRADPASLRDIVAQAKLPTPRVRQ